MTSPQPTDPTPPNAWFAAERDFERNPPAEPGIAEVPLDPADPEDLHRLLRAGHRTAAPPFQPLPRGEAAVHPDFQALKQNGANMVPPDATVADLTAEATFFTDRMGWPVRIDEFNRIVMTIGAHVDALRIPLPLAESVAYQLSANRTGAPITMNEHWWSIITAPRPNPNRELPRQLRRKQVYAVPSGGEVMLPVATNLSSWWQQPRPERALPPWPETVAIAHQVASRGD